MSILSSALIWFKDSTFFTGLSDPIGKWNTLQPDKRDSRRKEGEGGIVKRRKEREGYSKEGRRGRDSQRMEGEGGIVKGRKEREG